MVKKRNNYRNVASESVFKEGMLLIELKMSGHGGVEVMEDTDNSNMEGLMQKDQLSEKSGKRNVCKLRNGSFKSGKAPVGHTKKKSFKLSKNKQQAHVKKNPTVERPICPVCGMDFHSWRSMFGHMRTHPERKWRGSRPPPSEKTSSGSSCLSDQDDHLLPADGQKDCGGVDRMTCLKGWNPTVRRGRKRRSNMQMDHGIESDELDAVQGLMMLVWGDSEGGVVHGQKGDDKLEDMKSTKLDVGVKVAIKILESNFLIKNKKRVKTIKLSDLQHNGSNPVEGTNNGRGLQEIDLNKPPASMCS